MKFVVASLSVAAVVAVDTVAELQNNCTAKLNAAGVPEEMSNATCKLATSSDKENMQKVAMELVEAEMDKNSEIKEQVDQMKEFISEEKMQEWTKMLQTMSTEEQLSQFKSNKINEARELLTEEELKEFGPALDALDKIDLKEAQSFDAEAFKAKLPKNFQELEATVEELKDNIIEQAELPEEQVEQINAAIPVFFESVKCSGAMIAPLQEFFSEELTTMKTLMPAPNTEDDISNVTEQFQSDEVKAAIKKASSLNSGYDSDALQKVYAIQTEVYNRPETEVREMCDMLVKIKEVTGQLMKTHSESSVLKQKLAESAKKASNLRTQTAKDFSEKFMNKTKRNLF